ncbi:MAG: hypothetical protein JWN35_273 [Frankiales bacterium]|nr:hypothetical protein [Frankiales bacterium]
MKLRLLAVALLFGAVVLAPQPAFAAAAPPAGRAEVQPAEVQRPVPEVADVGLDYEAAIADSTGAAAAFAPLDPTITAASLADDAYQAISAAAQSSGGFAAPSGGTSEFTSAGRQVVGQVVAQQLPEYGTPGGGALTTFGGPPLPGAADAPPDNGAQPVAGLGTPTPPPAAGVPAGPGAAGPETGFSTPPTSPPAVAGPQTPTGGLPTPQRQQASPPAAQAPIPGPTNPVRSTTPSTPSTPPVPSAPPPLLPTPAPTTAPTTAPATGPTAGPNPPSPAPPPVPVSFAMTNDQNSQPLVSGSNLAPGSRISGSVLIGNAGTVPFTYGLRSEGASNDLWAALRLTVIDARTGRVLLDHTPLAAATTSLGTLNPGEQRPFLVALELPARYGNELQGQSARVDFVWHAEG